MEIPPKILLWVTVLRRAEGQLKLDGLKIVFFATQLGGLICLG